LFSRWLRWQQRGSLYPSAGGPLDSRIDRPFQSANRHEREQESQKTISYQRDIRKILIGGKIGNFGPKIDKMLYFIVVFLC